MEKKNVLSLYKEKWSEHHKDIQQKLLNGNSNMNQEKEPVIILPMYNTLCMYSKSKYVRKASFGHEQNLGETICENNPLLSIYGSASGHFLYFYKIFRMGIASLFSPYGCFRFY